MRIDIIILAALIAANFLAVIILSRFGKAWNAMLLPLLLIAGAIFSAKWLHIMGFDINVGNIFYATTFIIMHILIEQGNKKEAFLAIWVSAGLFAYFSLITFFAVTLSSTSQEPISSAMSLVFTTTLRGTFASMFAFILAQHTNIWIYDYFYKKHRGSKVLVRSSIAIVIGQFVDSILFFSVAFYEVLPLSVLLTAGLIGFVVKVIIGIIGSPLLYVERRLRG